MPERVFFIGGEWLTYEQAHRLGYTLLPPKIFTFYTSQDRPVSIRMDIATNQYYDSTNLRWVDDINELGLYKYINTVKLYRGESYSDYRGFSHSTRITDVEFIFYNSSMTDFDYLYRHYGITKYSCDNVIVENNTPIVWYDSHTNKYWDDRDGIKQWVDSIDDSKVRMYDSQLCESKYIYESESSESFYINGSFVSRDDFYSHDNYGIVRSVKHAFNSLNPDTVKDVYYDSLSEEYCIPRITDIWMSAEDIESAGWTLFDEYADFWRCQTPLHLLWKLLPTSAILSFANTQHSDLSISLPDSIESTIGSEIILPSIEGVYEDSSNIKWSPTRWSIGDFNSSYILRENTIANLVCDIVQFTITYTNTTYDFLGIEIPEPITIYSGDSITLPEITGDYYDDEGVRWYPLKWSAGEFGDTITPNDSMTINLICERLKVTLSFTNTTRPDLNITLPEPMVRYYGDDILLPSLYGLFRDEDGWGFRPVRYDIGDFGTLYRTYVDTVADLVWEQIVEMRDNALCGSMPGEDIKLVSDGIMISSPLPVEDTPWLYNPEVDNPELVLGGRIKKWDSSYVDHFVVFPEKEDNEPVGQFVTGTVRVRGNLENRNIAFDDFSLGIIDGISSYTPLPSSDKTLLYNPEIDNLGLFGGRIKKWDSSYTDHFVVFPEKDSEEHYIQAVTGTIRKSGNLANRFVAFEDVEQTGIMNYRPLPVADKPLLYNLEVDNFEILTGKIKKHEPTWEFAPEPQFPVKDEEPTGQFIGGTIRKKGNLANREIPIDGLASGLFTSN